MLFTPALGSLPHFAAAAISQPLFSCRIGALLARI